MAIIDPEGLFCGERLAACSDLAQLYWPRFFLAANSCARIELSYKSLVSRVFANFQKIPTSLEIWAIFREYEANFLAILYETDGGTWWCQFITSEKFLPKYKKTRDNLTPGPSLHLIDAHQVGYLAWKKSKSFQNQPFQKLPESFQREGVGIGVGIGVGVGVGEGSTLAPSAKKQRSTPTPIPHHDPGVFELPLADKTPYQVPQKLYSEYVHAYPGVNVMAQLASMRAWLISHPTRGKTIRGMPAFMNSWLSREQNRNGGKVNEKSKSNGQSAEDVLRELGAQTGADCPGGEDPARGAGQAREPGPDEAVGATASAFPW
jgi:hypothetical protein